MSIRLTLALACLAAALACTGCPKTNSTNQPGGAGATPTASNPPGPGQHSTPVAPAGQQPGTAPTTPAAGQPAGVATPPKAPADLPKPVFTGPPPDNAADVTNVIFETTKGKIEIAVHKGWCADGAYHFLQLVKVGYYDGAPWFRVLKGFAAQTGIAAIPAANEKWSVDKLKDEPATQHNMPGFVSYVATGPNSRSSQIFINISDNSALDSKGYTPFAFVTSGLNVINELFPISDKDLKGAGLDQTLLAGIGGMDAFKKAFPKADYITKAYVKP